MAGTEKDERTRAPGPLRLVQEFLESGHLDTAGRINNTRAEEIRARRAGGESVAALAAAFGVSVRFASAVIRGAGVEDDIANGQQARDWFTARGLAGEGPPFSEHHVAALKDLRRHLRAMAQANNGWPLPAGTLEAVQALAGRTRYSLDLAGPALRPVGDDGEAAIGAILALVFDAMRDGTWPRLKLCNAHDCPGVFYDATKNRARTWCAMSICGNRVKVRGYQARRRHAPAD